MSENHRLEQMASAVEDLLYMGAIILDNSKKDDGKALISPHFARIASNVMSSMKIKADDKDSQVLNLMYYAILIYMNEHLKLPKPFTIALGNDLEKNRENMECGELMTNYVTVLAGIWSQNVGKNK